MSSTKSDKETLDGAKLQKNAVDKEVAKRGGRRSGAGRPRGSRNKINKAIVTKEGQIKDRIMRNLDDLLTAQISLAKGTQYLFRIDIKRVGDRKTPIHTLVTDPEEIKRFLDGDADEDYYYITSQKPEARALDSLFDRVLGKSGQKNQSENNFNVNIIQYDKKPELEDGIREARIIEAIEEEPSGEGEEVSSMQENKIPR